MFVKVCGLRTGADVAAAVSAGADAIGFVFADSPRRVSAEVARELASQVPPHILTVGVFRGMTAGDAARISLDAGVGAVQLHGAYPRAAFGELAGLPVRLIRATALDASTDVPGRRLRRGHAAAGLPCARIGAAVGSVRARPGPAPGPLAAGGGPDPGKCRGGHRRGPAVGG